MKGLVMEAEGRKLKLIKPQSTTESNADLREKTETNHAGWTQIQRGQSR